MNCRIFFLKPKGSQYLYPHRHKIKDNRTIHKKRKKTKQLTKSFRNTKRPHKHSYNDRIVQQIAFNLEDSVSCNLLKNNGQKICPGRGKKRQRRNIAQIVEYNPEHKEGKRSKQHLCILHLKLFLIELKL